MCIVLGIRDRKYLCHFGRLGLQRLTSKNGFDIGFVLGLNWVCFFVKSAFSGEKRIKLGLFCIKRGDLSNVLYICRAYPNDPLYCVRLQSPMPALSVQKHSRRSDNYASDPF